MSSTCAGSAKSMKASRNASGRWCCDTAWLLNQAIRDGKSVLFEGAQGTMLDIDHGTYPFVTSSNASAGGACTGTGVPPTRISGVIGVSKAYITRVGGGPFPTEALGRRATGSAQRGKEFGAVTGRPRRCGWFDAPLLRYTAAINGFDSIVVTKLDVLDEFDTIPVCVGYRNAGRANVHEICRPRWRRSPRCSPSTNACPAGKSSTFGISSYDELPSEGQGLSGVSGGVDRRGSGLHLHRAGTQPDHRARRIALANGW